MNKRNIAISSCLLGNNVRYNGEEKKVEWVAKLVTKYNFIPVCPECEIGLGVPRPTIELHSDHRSQLRALINYASKTDITEKLEEWAIQARNKNKEIFAFILKARSPSCGLGTTPIFINSTKSETQFADGVVAAKLKKLFPESLFFDEVTGLDYFTKNLDA